MDGKTYPYLDMAALPEVGETLLDPRPAFVFAADGTRLLFRQCGRSGVLRCARHGRTSQAAILRSQSDQGAGGAPVARAAQRNGAAGNLAPWTGRQSGDAAGSVPPAEPCGRVARGAGHRGDRWLQRVSRLASGAAGGRNRRQRLPGSGDECRRQGARRFRRLRRACSGGARDRCDDRSGASHRRTAGQAKHRRLWRRAAGRRRAIYDGGSRLLPADRWAGGRRHVRWRWSR